MPNEKEPEVPGTQPEVFLDLEQITSLLIRHYGYKKGLFELAVQFQIGTGAIGPDKDHLLPGAMFGVAGLGLRKVTKPGPNTLDAAEVKVPVKSKAPGRSSGS